jgi:pimeloyl-ACP methyl ester carboxylesterase
MRVVLLHALPFGGEMWAGERDLAGGATIAPTLYGLGESLEEWAQGVLALVGDEPCVVVGCSVGGSCALEVARAAPDQVVALVLIGTKAGVRPEPAVRDEAVGRLRREGMAAAWDAHWRPLFGRRTPAPVVARAREMALAQPVEDVIRGVRAFHDRRDLTDVARSWTKPLVVISGVEDRTPRPEAAAAMSHGPRRELHLVPDCGHYVNLEQPARLRTLLASAIESVSGPVPGGAGAGGAGSPTAGAGRPRSLDAGRRRPGHGADPGPRTRR